MLNHIVIMGRLVRDPELRRTGSGVAVTSFTLAVDRDYNPKDGAEKETDFINCVAWRQTGEFVSKWFAKGSMIVVSGRLQMRKWTDDNGNNRTTYEIVADNVYFGGSKKENSNDSVGTGTLSSAYQRYGGHPVPYMTPVPITPASDFTLLDDDDAVLPF